MRLLATLKNVVTASYTNIAVVRWFGSGFVGYLPGWDGGAAMDRLDSLG